MSEVLMTDKSIIVWCYMLIVVCFGPLAKVHIQLLHELRSHVLFFLFWEMEWLFILYQLQLQLQVCSNVYDDLLLSRRSTAFSIVYRRTLMIFACDKALIWYFTLMECTWYNIEWIVVSFFINHNTRLFWVQSIHVLHLSIVLVRCMCAGKCPLHLEGDDNFLS